MGKPAARLGDMHTCPMYDGKTPHVGGPVIEGSSSVFIGGQPAATVGHKATCNGPPDAIATGSSTVFINSRPAARMGDATAHGGVIIGGCGTVFIGDCFPGLPGAGSVQPPVSSVRVGASGTPGRTKKERLQERRRLIAVGKEKAVTREEPEKSRLLAAAHRFEKNNENVEYAKLSKDVYHYEPANRDMQQPEGWFRLGDDPEILKEYGLAPEDLNPGDASGFRADLYISDPDVFGPPPKVILAAKGTTFSSVEDWINNLKQGVGLPSDYYKQMIRVSEKLSEFTGGDALITGHSLGGGMASAGSMATGLPAVTFNAAGLHPNALRWSGKDPKVFWDEAQDLIKAYKVDGDILTYAQEKAPILKWLMRDALGESHDLEAVKLAEADCADFEKLPPGVTVEKHSMDVVIAGIENEKSTDEQILRGMD